MPDQLTDRARKAAEEIAGEFYPQLRSLAGCKNICENCEAKTACRDAEAATTATMAEIIERHMRCEWEYEDIPTGERVLVAVEYHDGAPRRVGIGEVYVKDGKKEILVDDGIERLSVDLPLTVYAWRELPAAPPNVVKEVAPCPEE